MTRKENFLYWIVLCFSAGIVLNELSDVTKLIFILAFSTCLIFLALAIFLEKKTIVIAILIISLSFSIGLGRGHVRSVLDNKKVLLDEFVGQKVTLIGIVSEEQEKRDFNTRLHIKVSQINGQNNPDKTEVVVTTPSPKDFRYGDVLKVTGELIIPENFYTETGREFDYVGYLQSNNVRFLVRNASVYVNGYDPPLKILSWLFFAKREFVRSLAKMLPEPQSSLAAGILIDGKQSINGELQEKFRKTGLVHIVVLSGSNVSIIADAISRASMFLPRFAGMFSASLGIIAFAAITGASSTIVRASIMAIIVILSRASLRNYDPGRGLFIASFLMLLHNPTILLHSPSFQLSFLATFVVIRIVPFFETRAEFITERFGFRGLVVSNVVVQAFLFPILSWMTGFFSVVSLPVNILVLPLIPFTMLMSFLTAMTGLVARSASFPFAFVSQTLLSYELAVVDFFSGLSFAEVSFSGFSGWVVAGFYVVVIVSISLLPQNSSR